MDCERTVVVLLIFLCHSWYPRVEAKNGEGRRTVRSYLRVAWGISGHLWRATNPSWRRADSHLFDTK